MNLDVIPIFAFFLVTAVLVMAAIELGEWIGRAVRGRESEAIESTISTIATSILGLAGFMLAFTFSIVAERYDARRGLVRTDAIAIRTAWQRADFLPEADRNDAVAILQQYVDLRVKYAQTRNLDADYQQGFLAETQRLQNRLWSMAVANARKDMNSDVAALYIDSLNAVEAAHAERVAVALQARVPREIWLALYGLTLLGMITVGYQAGTAGTKRGITRTAIAATLALPFAAVFTLIATLDRPDSSVLVISQQPLIDLATAMHASHIDDAGK
jgi:hypothetical protein